MEITTTKNSLENHIKCLVYGFSGAGKTTLAGTLKDKTLILSFEAGLGSLNDFEIDVIDCAREDGKPLKASQRLKKLEEAYKFLTTKGSQDTYKTIFIDSLSEISDNLVESLQEDPEYSEAKNALKLWGRYNKESKAVIKAFRDLPNYNVVFTALCVEEKDENGNFTKGIDMPGKISQKAPQFFDEVLYLGKVKDKDGNEIRQLLTDSTTSIPYPKDRSGKLDKFEAPNLQLIFDKINNKKKEGE